MLFAGLRQERANDVDMLVDAAIAQMWGQTLHAAIERDPAISGYRTLHARVGARMRDVAAPELLRRMVIIRGTLPRISPVVDLYNIVSLRTGIAFGAHDLSAVVAPVTLRLTDGSERFVPLGTKDPVRVRAGEYAYVDANGDVLCRLEVRQGDKTKVHISTSDCMVIVQGNPDTGLAPVQAAADELAELVRRCVGGRLVDLTTPG
jgi:DNA/RNA-binding domain of Phe-tRNA-synthetase-like protein